ncbi:hypothetical protein NL108_010371 [Boleophthalmus pectinirostris]|uniref:zinc finger protein 414 n=1 Tax=Boleophthalmus pectinirostris TaxID=150288 RepID=UPI000A1C60C0|nr:zinc finger protein 414 [Boleophthalmus pectinirostris]KAJ0056568.1 hypothetical protein NL108_010371 [Boleophthalmus pectinirostris]
MSSGGVVVENRNEGNKRLSCPLYGCKRVYTDSSSLQSHIKDHEIPAQSVPGKAMMCSMIGCGGSFPNMQKLMEHLRHHHKPNVYFLCESCHAKLRSYRGLLHHLRSCSKAPKPKYNHDPSPSSSSTPPVPMEVEPTKPTVPPQDNLNPPPASSAPPQPQVPPVLTPSNQPQQPPQPNNLPLPSPDNDLAEPRLIQHIIDSTVNALFSKENQPISPVPEMQPEANPPESQIHQRAKTPENPGPPKLTPQTAPVNVWRAGQGPEKRVLWQHTRGRYTCVQCGHTVTNRKEMTEHSTYHSDTHGPKEETKNPATTSS